MNSNALTVFFSYTGTYVCEDISTTITSYELAGGFLGSGSGFQVKDTERESKTPKPISYSITDCKKCHPRKPFCFILFLEAVHR